MTRRRTSILSFIIILMISILSGCYMRPYVGGGAYYPENSDPDTAKYRLSVHVDGGRGHAFNEMTEKDIYISVRGKDDAVLLERKYILQAGALHWDVSWTALDDLKIVLYEEERGINLTDKNLTSHVPRQICTLNFTYNPNSREFIEANIPSFVISKIQSRLERASKTHVVSLYLRIENNNSQLISDALRKVAKDFSLNEIKTPNCSNCFAFYVETDFEMKVLKLNERETSDLVIEVIDWGRKDLSAAIVAALKQSLKITKELEANKRSDRDRA